MKYIFDRVINERYAVWYKEILNKKGVLGAYKVIDLYPGTREKRFVKRYKAKQGQDQESLDTKAMYAAIRAFKKITTFKKI